MLGSETEKEVNGIESVSADADINNEKTDVVAEKAAETKLEGDTERRLQEVFEGGGIKEESAEESKESDDSTPESEKGELEEKSDEEDETTLVAKDDADDKNKEVEVKAEAKDEEADKGEKDVPQLSDAYYRAAIHRGMKPEEIEDFYKANPQLCVNTLGNIYEAVKRSNEEFATLGRAHKERKAQEAAAKATPSGTEGGGNVESGYKGVDFAALEKADIDPDGMAVIKAMDQQNRAMYDEIQSIKQTAPVGQTLQESRALTQESAAIQQQIGNFFRADELKLYSDFYGTLPKDAATWDTLSPGQKANRWAVIEMMDNLLVGVHMNNRDMSIDEAMNLAHLNISESEREKVIRAKLQTDVVKRNKGITLKPSGAAKSEASGAPKTDEELVETTQERLNKVFG